MAGNPETARNPSKDAAKAPAKSQSRDAAVALGRQHWLAARPRVFVAAAVGIAAGLVVGIAMPQIAKLNLRAVIGWDAGVIVYLALVLVMMARATPALVRHRALREAEEARWAFLVLMAGAAFFSLFATLDIVHGAKAAGGLTMIAELVLAGLTLFLSWLLAHTVFAVHYTHEYFYDTERKREPGLVFPSGGDDRGDHSLAYWDFLYFSFSVGMTAGATDVRIVTSRWRRMVLAHGILSFLFNAVVLALSISLFANFL